MTEELKEFWEWCGFERYGYQGNERTLMRWKYPDSSRNYVTPNLDLNNLFKWAVPKAVKVIQDAFICIQEAAMQHLFSEWLAIYWKPRQEPISIAEALYKAIQKIRRENES